LAQIIIMLCIVYLIENVFLAMYGGPPPNHSMLPTFIYIQYGTYAIIEYRYIRKYIFLVISDGDVTYFLM